MTAVQVYASRMGGRVAERPVVLAVALAILSSACADAEPFRTNISISSSDGAGDRGAGGKVDAGGLVPDADPIGETLMGGFGGAAGSVGTGGQAGAGSSGSGGSGGATDGGGTGGVGTGGASGTGGMAGATGTGGGSGGQAGAGTGGSGGSTVDGCARANWTITATVLCDTPNCVNIPARYKDPKYAIDGDSDTRYTSGRPQGTAGQEKVVLTFPKSVTIGGLQLMTSAPGDGAAAYKVEYATTGTNFVGFSPAVAGNGSDDIRLTFPPTAMKALRITQTGSKADTWWSIHELVVMGCLN